MADETKNPLEIVFSPEGIVMLPLAILLDLAGIISTILILAFGAGYVIGIIVDVVAICLIMPWSLIRGSFKGSSGKIEETAISNISSSIEAQRAGKAAKAVKAGRAVKSVKAARVVKLVKLARWFKILTPIKNRIPGLGLIPTWTPSVWFELQT